MTTPKAKFADLALIAVLCAGFTLGLTAPAGAGFKEGAAAYQRGDYATAIREWRPLAKQGHANAQFNLGIVYRRGQGVRQDYSEAIKWYCRAAVQGYGRSLVNLGIMYRKGMGLPQDNIEGAKWYRMAADSGNAGGQINMGSLYLKGEGVPEDLPSAYLWFSLAAKQVFGGARHAAAMRDETAKKLSPDQLKAGEMNVQNWTPEPFDEAMAAKVRKSAACARSPQ